MTNEKYNGWTNYATWRVNLEIFHGANIGDYDAEEQTKYVLAERLKDLAHEVVLADVPDGYAYDYAFAFLREVNFLEIAERLTEGSEDRNERKN